MSHAFPSPRAARRLLFVAAAVVAIAAPIARALSPTPALIASGGGGTATARSGTALGYMTHQDTYYDIVDVDGDRMSLRALLEPPAPPRAAPEPPAPEPTTRGGGAGRASRRPQPVTELRSIEDYQRHVLHNSNQLSIIRFSSPACKLCRTTAVAWERMAGKIGPRGGGRIRFLSVSVDGRDRATVALKDLLRVERVPSGILHHPAGGILGSKLDLDRSSLTALRKRLEAYVEEGARGGSLLDVPEFQL